MSSIETYLQYIASKVWARDVRTAIVNAIRQCYDDVHNPTLNTEALQAAIQAKIDAGQMAALTIGDRTITAAKLALGVIPTPDATLSQSGVPADAKKTGDEISAINESLGDVRADLANKEQLSDDIDFNDLKETGVYGLHVGRTYINSPKSHLHGVLEVWKEYIDGSYNRTFQKVTYYITNVNVEVWVRIYGTLSGAWTEWTRLDVETYENRFVNEIYSKVMNLGWATGSGVNLEFVDSPYRISTGIPHAVDYDLKLSTNEGYSIAIFEVASIETPTPMSTGLVRTSGWITDAYIPKNTPFYFQIKKTTNEAIEPSEFLSSITSNKSEKELTKVFDLCMFAGQSNMAGRGVTSQQWPETAPVVSYGAGYEFKAITNPNYISPLAEPFGKNENNTNGINDGTMKTGSMAAAFVNAYYANNGNIPVIAVSASVGRSGIDDWQPNTAYLNDAISRFNAAKNFIVSRGYTIRHKFLVWCQGEHEAGTPETTDDASYISDFNTMFNALKTATGIEKCLLCRIGEYNGTGEDFSTVIQKQTELAKTNKDVIMVTTTLASFKDRGLMKDTLHFYQAGYNEMGEYAGINAARYVMTGKEPVMYDPKSDSLYYSEKN